MTIMRCVCLVLLTAASVFAQSYKRCEVTAWTSQTQSQSVTDTRHHIVYLVRIGNVNYQIARHIPKEGESGGQPAVLWPAQAPDQTFHNLEMNAGQQLQCRTDKGDMLVRNLKGQVNKYQIIEVGRRIQTLY